LCAHKNVCPQTAAFYAYTYYYIQWRTDEVRGWGVQTPAPSPLAFISLYKNAIMFSLKIYRVINPEHISPTIFFSTDEFIQILNFGIFKYIFFIFSIS